MKRTGFKRPERERKPVLVMPIRQVAPSVAKALVVTPKENAWRSEAYRRAVAALPCYLCGTVGYSQCAHADEAKGLSLKSSDDTCYPLCCSRPGVPGCHVMVGASGTLGREARRALEKEAAKKTRALLAHLLP